MVRTLGPRTKGAAILVLVGVFYLSAAAQQSHAPASSARPLRWPVPAGDQSFATISGAHIKTYLNDLVAVTRSARPAGAQYWGRITGQPSDATVREWVATNFKQVGLKDVRIDPFDLEKPQWVPSAWDITLAGGAAHKLVSAHPFRESVATPAGGVDLPAIWLGLGTEFEFSGHDVRGKAAFIYSQPFPSAHNHSANIYRALDRARDAGAAAIVVIIAIPGNFAIQMNLPSQANASLIPADQRGNFAAEMRNAKFEVPVFSMGMEDGEVVRKALVANPSTKVHVGLDAKMVPGLKSGTVWGTLPGTSEEEILVMAHRDGYFDGAGDNASGIASMLGLAEYFAKVPAAQRRRTIRFMAATGHHMIGPTDVVKLHENRQTALAKTALILNFEHVGWTQTYVYDLSVRKATGVAPLRWGFNGSDALKSIMFGAFSEFGVNTLQDEGPTAMGDAMPVARDAPSIGVISSPDFFHSNLDSPDVVPESALEAATRAYAKIIVEANRLSKAELTGSTPRTSASVK